MSNDKLTPARHQIICQAAEKGYSKTIAAATAEVCRQSVSNWLDLGEAGDERYEQLFKDWQAGRAKYEQSLLDKMDNMPEAAVLGTIKHITWRLSRLYPQDYCPLHFNNPLKFDKINGTVDLYKAFELVLEKLGNGEISTIQAQAAAKVLEAGCKIHEDTIGREKMDAIYAFCKVSKEQDTKGPDKSFTLAEAFPIND